MYFKTFNQIFLVTKMNDNSREWSHPMKDDNSLVVQIVVIKTETDFSKFIVINNRI